MDPLVSVIIPNYNYAHFLAQRIDSVLNQSYQNIEIIILDDCSTDNSCEIIDKYKDEKKVKHIIYNKVNSGSTFKQWDKGFENATGEFIWIAECDDYAAPTFLEELVHIMQNDKTIKIGFSNSYWVTPERTFINRRCTIKKTSKIYNGKKFIKSHMLKGNYIYNASMAIFRRDSIPYTDFDYKNYKSCGDKLFWISIANTGKVLYLCKPLNYFRIHSNKVTNKSIANGTLFKEEYKLYLKNIHNGYINLFNRGSIISYFLQSIHDKQHEFQTNDIYEECLSLWKHETDYHNNSLPLLYRLFYYFKGIKDQK